MSSLHWFEFRRRDGGKQRCVKCEGFFDSLWLNGGLLDGSRMTVEIAQRYQEHAKCLWCANAYSDTGDVVTVVQVGNEFKEIPSRYLLISE